MGITFGEFCGRFGGSFRTKNLHNFDWLTRMGVSQAHPAWSEIPIEFIRIDPWEGEYLYMVAERARVGILEIGRFNGGTAFMLGCANEGVPLWSIDIEPQDDLRLGDLFQQTGFGSNVDLIVGDSQHEQNPRVGDFDVLFIDGDHSYEGCSNDLRNWYPRLAPGGHIVLHDGYSGSPVADAVRDFADQYPVTVLLPPYIRRAHWDHPTGSMAHLRKPK